MLSTPNQFLDILWSYWGKKGENSWEKEFDKCRGRMQSPINIDTNKLIVDESLNIEFINYDKAVNKANMFNTGYKVKIYADENSAEDVFISGSALNNQTYKFIELHFHWNDGPNNGSEHAIDGQKFVMECHIMHRNIKYNDMETANAHDDGYAIIALVYIELDEPNLMYDMITDHLHNVQDIGQQYTFETSIYLESLLPPNREVFYRYFGSYTTPRCNEAVTWIIYPELVFIDKKQV
ncbi:unnamed protein product [Medioppia subpectinata]|uniref:Alpha-carbonic anhydrase domain-containing protein n=1 Tax=Medioppia subpectinata TaxID=1979941 RepID=A0A7R9PY11_9ACAR|nr:unnamed protein product [Medioppia subpectinata]CAG2105388.1 unnamed protein product [Medioppia subpectinata]